MNPTARWVPTESQTAQLKHTSILGYPGASSEESGSSFSNGLSASKKSNSAWQTCLKSASISARATSVWPGESTRGYHVFRLPNGNDGRCVTKVITRVPSGRRLSSAIVIACFLSRDSNSSRFMCFMARRCTIDEHPSCHDKYRLLHYSNL